MKVWDHFFYSSPSGQGPLIPLGCTCLNSHLCISDLKALPEAKELHLT